MILFFIKGVKAKKKKEHKESKKELPTDRPKNPKAFAINAVRSAENRFHRKQDLKTKKHHIPIVDHTSEDSPPIVIGIHIIF